VEQRRCAVCQVPHTRWRDQAHTMPASYCHECHARHMRDTRPKHTKLSKTQRRRANARAYANTYQRRGKLAPMPCEKCGIEETVKHHDDYRKPLAVRWFCRPCHRAHHSSLG